MFMKAAALSLFLLAEHCVADQNEECLTSTCGDDGLEEAFNFIQRNAQAVKIEEDDSQSDATSVEETDVADETESLQYRMADAYAWVPAKGCSGILCNGNCPITQNPTSDGGCCNSGSIGTGHKSCVKISSTNILKYACGLSETEAAGTPSCKNDASFFSNKDKVEICSLGGQTCTYTKYGWWSRKVNIGGGNKADKLSCTCEDVPTYRREDDDSAWALGLVEVEPSASQPVLAAMQVESRVDESLAWKPATGCTGILCMGNCPITQVETSDGGCCPSGSIGTGRKSCVRVSSANLLKYSCGLMGTPSCKNDANFFSNKDKEEVCSLQGEKCTQIQYGWWSSKINIGGGNKQDKLSCSCGDGTVYRRERKGDGPWVVGR